MEKADYLQADTEQPHGQARATLKFSPVGLEWCLFTAKPACGLDLNATKQEKTAGRKLTVFRRAAITLAAAAATGSPPRFLLASNFDLPCSCLRQSCLAAEDALHAELHNVGEVEVAIAVLV